MDPAVGTATIVFSDIVDSTRMRVEMGDIAADEQRRRHDQILEAVIARHNGTVIKHLGDGLLASFVGSAEAVAAAVAMQREVDREWQRAAVGEQVEIRVGLSAGDVTWEDGDCHGTPVVTASRLCDAADGGQVLCDDLVRGLARGRTEASFELVGELDLKGLPEPVMVYAVPWDPMSLSALPLPAPLRPVAGELPYAGRTEELVQVRGLWKSAQTDGARVVLIVGEPGIGKSRLMAEVARQAHDEGAQVLLGRCDEQIPAPYAPWIEALRALVANVDEQVLADHVDRHGGAIGRLVPEVASRIPGVAGAAGDDPDTERLRLFEAVTDLLERAGAASPVLLLLEDAHWADAGSVSLLRHLASHIDVDAPVLVGVSFRDTDVDRSHALGGVLGDLHRSARTERISLQGLDESGIVALLEGTAGHGLDRDEDFRFVRRLVEETEGNPFFISEVLRHMVEQGLLVQEEGRWVGTISVVDGGLPEGVRDVVGQRLSRFSEEVNDLLRVAAVMGREFDLAPLAGIVGRSEDSVAEDLEAAIGAGLVNEVEDQYGRLAFEHALVRQTLLEELSTNKRIRIHRRVAESLDERGAPPDVLAHHYCEAALAGVAERAVEVSRQAADAAADSFAWDDAIRLVERAQEALDAADDPDPAMEVALLCDLARFEHGRGSGETARRLALDAASIARRVGDPVLLGYAGIAYQGEVGMWARPSDEVGVALLQEALDAMPEEEGERATVAATLAHAVILAPGSYGLIAADDAVAAARTAGNEGALQRALIARAWSVRGALPASERVAAAEEAMELGGRRGDPSAAGSAAYLLGGALLCLPDIAAGLEAFENLHWRGALEGWPAAGCKASLAAAEGRFEEAEELSILAHGLGEPLGDTNDAVRAGQAILLALDVGDLETARRWNAKALETVIGLALPYAALIEAAESPAVAGETLRHWIRDVDPSLANMLRFIASVPVARIAFGADDRCGADGYVELLDAIPGELIANDTGIMGATDWVRGLFAAVDGRLDDAVALVKSGHAMHTDLGLHARTVRSGHDLASILLRRDAPGDRERARALLDDVITQSRKLGMRPVMESASAMLD